MNKIESFLEDLLISQDLTDEQEDTLQAHKNEITDFLRDEFGDDPVIKYAGSHEKGTMIQDNFDLDIVCYFSSDDLRSLKEIRDDVSNHLKTKYLIQSKSSAERITNLKDEAVSNDYHIDVVPGRFIQDTKDVFLHVASEDRERLKTNLKTHIDHIKESGCVQVIRLIKIWSHRNKVNVKTFVLELFVVETLKGSLDKNDLKESFLTVIEAIKDDFENTQLIDPANSNNIVSGLISTTDKRLAAQIAEDAFSLLEGSDATEDWEKVFCHESKKTNSSNSSSTPFTPNRPWCN